MNRTIVTYETFHGSAKKIAEVIANKLNCKYINIDTPFEAEDLREIDNIILVFNFRGPYTAEKEFPVVADEIYRNNPSKTFTKFFVNGQLRMATLSPEERALLKKFSELTGMEIKDMGELDLDKASKVASEIEKLIDTEEFKSSKEAETVKEEEQTKWVCSICGYVHYGDNPPEKCPVCGVPKELFKKQ